MIPKIGWTLQLALALSLCCSGAYTFRPEISPYGELPSMTAGVDAAAQCSGPYYLPKIPSFENGETAQKYSAELLINVNKLSTSFPVNLLATSLLESNTTLQDCAKEFQSKSNTSDLPNYNSDFGTGVSSLSGTKIKWIVEAQDRAEDDPVILYFHGGGYYTPPAENAVDFWSNIWRNVSEQSDRLSVLWIDYDLSIQNRYPTQLRQATEVYNAISDKSKNVMLAGDSAGAHLALNLIRHQKYQVETVPKVNAAPRGLFLFSPMVNIFPTSNNGTYAEYEVVDITYGSGLASMGTLLVPDEATRLSTPLNPWKDHIDWSEILPESSKIFVCYGEKEVLKGDIESWIDISGISDSNATIFNQPGGHHDDWTIHTTNSTIFPIFAKFLKNNIFK